ncbi:hypothetical protein AXF42_Ash006784 [Apostasia shenzhenica]|uniref:Uncharacterized protein n=1 Tax=Apostasia shenzhenica TaxID=1088818 RepID=A0A2I0AJ41_9ASPA|nr:hypothetical protein AXF42_Ash006784 [Apostasia shenzhenica]
METSLLTNKPPPSPSASASASASEATERRPSSSPSIRTIATRLSSLLLLLSLSLWANHEASKGFAVSVLNSAAASPAGRRFNLLFASNGRAATAVFLAAAAIEPTLFPDPHLFPRKPIRRISIELACHNISSSVILSHGPAAGEFTVSLSPDLATGQDSASKLPVALRYGVARALLWDGGGASPPELMEALADYLTSPSSFKRPAAVRHRESCWAAAEFVEFCERRRPGFVARLNRAMREGWTEVAVDQALESPYRMACTDYLRRRPPPRRRASSSELHIRDR